MQRRLKECSTVFPQFLSEWNDLPSRLCPQITLPGWQKSKRLITSLRGTEIWFSVASIYHAFMLHVGAPHPHYNRIRVRSEELLFRHDCDVEAWVPSSRSVFGCCCCCCTPDPEMKWVWNMTKGILGQNSPLELYHVSFFCLLLQKRSFAHR